jgi:hypothetical protein
LTEYEKKLRGIATANGKASAGTAATVSISENGVNNNLDLTTSTTSPGSASSSSSLSGSGSGDKPLAVTSSAAPTIDEQASVPEKQQQQQEHEDSSSSTEFKQPPSVDMSVHFLGFLSKLENSVSQQGINNPINVPRISTPNIDSPLSNDPFAIGSMIQSPIVNNATNNITNSYFNTNFTTQVNNNPILSSGNTSNGNTTNNNNSNANLISFNSSTFPLANQDMLNGFPSGLNSPVVGNASAPQPIVDAKKDQAQPIQPSDSLARVQQNPNLYNSLSAYSSNPATTINYLYGTNTYYENSNLLDDLYQFLPPTKERSFELMDRYLNSVHLLLPIVVNMTEFLHEHKRYWEIRTKAKRRANSASTESPSNSQQQNPIVESPCDSNQSSHHHLDVDFNFVQFYTLYFPILYASTISEFEEYDNLLLNQDIDKYLKGFNKICQYYNYPHGIKTIPLLLGNVIIQSTSPNPSTMEMAQIIRYAKFLHFHKDPYITLRIKDREVIKFRRLLWWVIFGLDALSSHNFCLPPNCRIDDFNVLMPDEEEPKDASSNSEEKKLNLGMVSMNVKFGYDRILSELVYHLHNGLSENITPVKINEIKKMITDYHKSVQQSIDKINKYFTFKTSGNYSIQEINLINFVKSHSWSYVDRALMLLHKKILLGSPNIPGENEEFDVQNSNGLALEKYEDGLTLSKYEDTFGQILEANIIKNFNNSSISLLKYGDFENFSYDDLNNNLIPSILHNFNDFLQYDDFIKFGRFNWYVKRTIPIDSVIIMMVIISVKFKYKFIDNEEFAIYKNLINNVLFIINRKWFKNEKYKRMLSLTNMMWEYLIKKHTGIKDTASNGVGNSDIDKSITSVNTIDELQLKEKILYDLRHNFIDVNDYCSFYSSLENLLNQLLKYIE